MKRFTAPLRRMNIIPLLALLLIFGCGDDTEKSNKGENNTANNGTNSNNGSGNNGSGSNGNNGNTGNNGTVVDSPRVDPACIDGMWSESLPTPEADISAEIAAFSSATPNTFINDVLAKRYPFGATLVAEGRQSQQIGDCVEFFLSDPNSPDAVIGELSTLVHECGHFADIELAGFGDAAYILSAQVTIQCEGGSSQTGNSPTPARSLINNDSYDGAIDDFYKSVYLDGDPTDGEFDGGDQGMDTVLEETTQYVNSLATGYAFSDFISGSVSERDGILTFLWYLTRYLRLMREDFPAAYESIVGDECWREAILSVWGRAWMYVELTKGNSSLGINDAALLPLAETPELLNEVQLIRDRQGC